VRKGLVRFLRARGFFVVGSAEDGAEAIQLVSEVHVDAVIAEINLPVLDGLTLNAIMHEQFPTVQVVISRSIATRFSSRRRSAPGQRPTS
jgi:two-component system, response regulator YesN